MMTDRGRPREINVADVEHLGALFAGGLCYLAGMRRKGLVGTALKATGIVLLLRGQQGYRRLWASIGVALPTNGTGVGRQNARVESEIVVSRPRSEIYRIWRNLQNLPIFMDQLISVNEVDDQRSIWVARAPGGTVVKWDARIINDIENELIAWETLEGSGVDHAGSIHFDEDDMGRTRIRIVLRYDPPADGLGIWAARMLGMDPKVQIDKDLLRFKAIMELGNESQQKTARKRANVM